MKKSYLLIAIILIASLVLSACGTPAETPVATEPPVVEDTEAVVVATEEPTEEPTVEVVEPAATLRIWADEQRAPVLSELGAKFLAEYNVEVVVENISGIRDQFLVAAPAGEGPDIIVLATISCPP